MHQYPIALTNTVMSNCLSSLRVPLSQAWVVSILSDNKLGHSSSSKRQKFNLGFMFCWKTVVLVKIILRFLLGLNRVAKVGAATLFAGHIDDKRVSLESSSREISPIQSKV